MIDVGDEEPISKTIDQTFERYRYKRPAIERSMFRNLLFLLGIQWIRWDANDHTFRKPRLAKWVPMPVTNRYASTGERLVSVLSRVEPNWTFIPASEREEDLVAAAVADTLEEIICEENMIELLRQDIAPWLIYTGNVFLFSNAEQKMSKLSGIAGMQTALPGMPDPSGSAMMPIAGGLMPPPPMPDYRLYTDVYSPFEVWGDLTIPQLKDQRKILIVSRRDKDWASEMYGIDTEEKTDPSTLGLRYLESIGYLTDNSVGREDYAVSGSADIPRVTVKRILIAPCDDYPSGLYSVKIGDKIVDSMEWPSTPEGEPINPLNHMKFGPVPGAFYGRTPMNDIVRKQEARNRLESIIELIATRTGSPIWLIPSGTKVDNWSGEPGSKLTYTLLTDRATRPDRIPGEQIQPTLLELLKQYDADIEELAATFEALKGKSPYSGAPGVVVDQLIEQGMSRFGPALRSVAEGYRGWMKTQIELFRIYGVTPRTIATLGENAKWKFSKFSNADIQGSVNVRIEADSTVPRSESVTAAKIERALGTGLIDIGDPVMRQKALKKLGLGEFMKQLDDDMLAAVKENEIIATGQMVPVNPFIDNHAVHIAKHRSFANSDEGKPFMQILTRHIAEHNMMADAEMNASAEAGNQVAGKGKKKQVEGPKEAVAA